MTRTVLNTGVAGKTNKTLKIGQSKKIRPSSSHNKSIIVRTAVRPLPISEIVTSGQAQAFLESFYETWEHKQMHTNGRSKKMAHKIYSRVLLRVASAVDITKSPRLFVARVRAQLCKYEKGGDLIDDETINRRALYYESILIFENKYVKYLHNAENLTMLSPTEKRMLEQNIKLALKCVCMGNSISRCALESNLAEIVKEQSMGLSGLRSLVDTASELV